MHSYLKPLEEELLKNVDLTYAVSMEKYMRNHFKYIGIKSSVRKEIFKSFFTTYSLPELKDLPQIIDDLWNNDYRDFQYFAVELLIKLKKMWDEEIIYLFEDLLQRKSWWDSVDYITPHLVGEYFKLYPQNKVQITTKWNHSENFWLQRASIIFQLKYKVQTDTELLSNHIKNLTHSKEFFVQKAIGWALREYSKMNPTFVVDFVKNNKLKPLSQREAIRRIKK